MKIIRRDLLYLANSHSASAVMHEYAGQARSTKWARDLLIVAIGSATPF